MIQISPPEKPENRLCKSFNAKVGNEFLNDELFKSMVEAKVLIKRRIQYYNKISLHNRLAGRPPAPKTFMAATARLYYVSLTIQVKYVSLNKI